MNSLEAFLNNGRMPFVGRASELDRVAAFVDRIPEFHGLQVTLVTGEAGVGKSRFVEELIPLLSARRVVVAHVKLHGDSHLTVNALLADALDRADIGLRLLKVHPIEDSASVIGAVRRLSRLRPTLLIVEDIEHLQGNAIPPFAALVSALADETLAILCLARPVDLEARGILERYATDQFSLAPLRSDEVETAYRELFDTLPTEAVLESVMDATHGNALAVRGALRGAVQSGALQWSEVTGGWRLSVSEVGLTTLLKQNVRVVAQGLAAHLSSLEKEAARQLAVLGVVFSREAAHMMLSDADEMIDALIFKGIVATATTPVVAVNLKVSAYQPLVFTHSLTQEQMAEHAQASSDLLVRLIAAAPPLYSTTPFQFLFDHAGSVSSDCPDVGQAINEALGVAQTLDKSSAWQKRVIPWGVATGLISRFVVEWDAQTCADMQATLLRYDFFLHARNPVDQQQLVDRILQFTTDERSRAMNEARIVALAHWLKKDVERAGDVFGQVDTMLDRYALLGGSSSYCYFLGVACEALLAEDDGGWSQRLEARLDRAYSSPWLQTNGRRQLLESHLRLIGSFQTEDELARRYDLLERLETETSALGRRIDRERARLLFDVGRIDEAAAAAANGIRYADECGLREDRWELESTLLAIGAVQSDDCEAIALRCGDFLATVSEGRRAAHRDNLASRLLDIYLLRDQIGCARNLSERLQGDPGSISPFAHIALAMEGAGAAFGEDDPVAVPASPVGRAFADLIAAYLSDNIVDEQAVATAISTLAAAPILRLADLVRLRAALDLAEGVAAREREAPASRIGPLHDALTRSLAWMAHETRRLDTVMTAFVSRYGSHLSQSEREHWHGITADIVRQRRKTVEQAHQDERITINVLGQMAITFPDGRIERLTGLRVKTMAGLMVANAMMRHPLNSSEFCCIAAGVAEYDKSARVAANGIIWRLRELVGHDAIYTSGETPLFSSSCARVDLLEAHRLIEETIGALRSRRLVHARASMTAALDIVGGKVPFPSLYDECFETARATFEASLQAAIAQLARQLLMEGDRDGASDLLRLGLEVLPGDGELEEILTTTVPDPRRSA